MERETRGRGIGEGLRNIAGWNPRASTSPSLWRGGCGGGGGGGGGHRRHIRKSIQNIIHILEEKNLKVITVPIVDVSGEKSGPYSSLSLKF